MPKLLPVRPGTVTPDERARLLGEGYLVIEHTDPGEVASANLVGDAGDLPSMLVRFIGDLSDRLPDACFEVTSTVKVCPRMRTTGGGPPINADGALVGPLEDGRAGAVTHDRREPRDLFVFVAMPSNVSFVFPAITAGVAILATPSSSPALTFTAASPWASLQATHALAIYRVSPGAYLSWAAVPGNCVVWKRQALANE